MKAPAAGKQQYRLRRRAVVADLLAERGDSLVVAGLGAPAWDVTAAGDSPLNFPLWGAMGSAVPLGLGLALAQPRRRVLVITGDGEMLMGLGALATAALAAPTNLAIVVLDNEAYGETGNQATHTAAGTDIAAIGAAAGLAWTRTVADDVGLEVAREQILAAPGPGLCVIKVRIEELPLVLPPRDGMVLRDRFRAALRD